MLLLFRDFIDRNNKIGVGIGETTDNADLGCLIFCQPDYGIFWSSRIMYLCFLQVLHSRALVQYHISPDHPPPSHQSHDGSCHISQSVWHSVFFSGVVVTRCIVLLTFASKSLIVYANISVPFVFVKMFSLSCARNVVYTY